MAMLMAPGTIKAQNFDDYFTDKTLRIDYTFAGNQKQQMIAVDELNVMPRWYGKRQRLAELPVEGNGQITVRDHRSGKIIYRNSFSTLFQEWLSYPEAEKNTQSFENVFLVPMPKDTVDITLDLLTNCNGYTTCTKVITFLNKLSNLWSSKESLHLTLCRRITLLNLSTTILN